MNWTASEKQPHKINKAKYLCQGREGDNHNNGKRLDKLHSCCPGSNSLEKPSRPTPPSGSHAAIDIGKKLGQVSGQRGHLTGNAGGEGGMPSETAGQMSEIRGWSGVNPGGHVTTLRLQD